MEKKTNNKMSHKQIMFCEEYLKTGNATKSYLEVYKSKSEASARALGSKALTNINIKKYIEERQKNVETEAIANADEILETFTKILRGEVKDQFGMETSVKDRITAGKELAKRYGIFKEPEKEKITGINTPPTRITVVDNSGLEKALYDADRES